MFSPFCHLSSFLCHLSSVICHKSSIICHLLALISNLKIFRLLSAVIYHFSAVSCHIDFCVVPTLWGRGNWPWLWCMFHACCSCEVILRVAGLEWLHFTWWSIKPSSAPAIWQAQCVISRHLIPLWLYYKNKNIFFLAVNC